jgi:hypothetical protein
MSHSTVAIPVVSANLNSRRGLSGALSGVPGAGSADRLAPIGRTVNSDTHQIRI